jgi:hypothetical protein
MFAWALIPQPSPLAAAPVTPSALPTASQASRLSQPLMHASCGCASQLPMLRSSSSLPLMLTLGRRGLGCHKALQSHGYEAASAPHTLS